MSDDAVDYGSSSAGRGDEDSESDKVPSRLPARAESCILAHDLSVLHAGFGCAPCDSKEAVEQLKARYPEEAKNVALDIKTKLGELALQHQASAQHQHPEPKPDVVVSSSDPASSGDDSH